MIVSLLLSLCFPAFGADLTVGPTRTYATVADAVAAAQPGDVLLVDSGDYSGDLTLTRPISLRSVGTTPARLVGSLSIRTNAAIDGFLLVGNAPTTPVVTVDTGASLRLENAEIQPQNAVATAAEVLIHGDATFIAVVWATPTAGPHLSAGAGANVSVSTSRFERGGAGAIVALEAASLLVDHSRFSANVRAIGTDVYTEQVPAVELTKNVFGASTGAWNVRIIDETDATTSAINGNEFADAATTGVHGAWIDGVDAEFSDNRLMGPSVLLLSDAAALEARRNWTCGGSWTISGPAALANNGWFTARDEAMLTADGAMSLDHGWFGSLTSPTAIAVDGTANVTNSAFIDVIPPWTGDGITGDNNLLCCDATAAVPPGNNLAVDYLGLDGDYTVEMCSDPDGFRFVPDSLALVFGDDDGIPSPVGPFGGPFADPRYAVDADDDGSSALIDCDDTDPAFFAEATDVCDGLDNDCDLTVDEGVPEICNHADEDCDGIADDQVDADDDTYYTAGVCNPADADCDDTDASVHPGAAESTAGIDDDCDGRTDESALTDDNDGDGYCPGFACPGLLTNDCDDDFPGVNPRAFDVPNGIDDDCNGAVDDGLIDRDGDGKSGINADCDESNPTVYVGATEQCNGRDDNCDGKVPSDEFDADHDGFLACDDCDDANERRNPNVAEIANNGIDDNCDGLVDPLPTSDADGDGVTLADGDCNDADPQIPGIELCGNDLDDDCDGDIDEGFDADGDGVQVCGPTPDCDDANPYVHPGRVETPSDGLDNDCSGTADDCSENRDFDGADACHDCADTDPKIAPGNAESCNGLDDNCDGRADEGLDPDGDGFAICTGDCATFDAATYPGAAEVCDGIDNDCDDVIPADELTDADTDGFVACEDCDDANNAVFPGAEEIVNQLDDNCDGDIDETTGDTDTGDDTDPLPIDDGPLRFTVPANWVCGCAATPTPTSALWVFAVGLLIARRRR